MPINYFETRCKTQSKEVEFGLCDDPPPSNVPAYIDENDKTKWIGIVKNPGSKQISFHAIDNCIDIRRHDNKTESRCDGLLAYSSNLIFVELKERDGGKWFKKGREQLTTTIKRFKAECDITQFKSIRAHVCNNLRPQANFMQAVSIQKFKDDTGFILETTQEIRV